MDPEQARQRFFHGAALLLFDAPAGTIVGFDYYAWTVTENFRGIKMIPPGIHCLHYR